MVRPWMHPSVFVGRADASVSAGCNKEGGSAAGEIAPEHDRFGRRYESSIFQWLPATFCLKTSRFIDPVHPLYPRQESTEELYESLEGVMKQVAWPLLRRCWMSARDEKYLSAGGEGMDDLLTTSKDNRNQKRFYVDDEDEERFASVQIITKIADYEFSSACRDYEGVWHVEGMSHERIVATACVVLEKPDCVTGGDLYFRAPFTKNDGRKLLYEIPQDRPDIVDHWIEELGLYPLGKVEMPAGKALAWPNSFVHKLGKMELISPTDSPHANKNSVSVTQTVRRRILVFWLVDPANPQELTTKTAETNYSVERALQSRLALMEERKKHKENWNQRAVTLCEH